MGAEWTDVALTGLTILTGEGCIGSGRGPDRSHRGGVYRVRPGLSGQTWP